VLCDAAEVPSDDSELAVVATDDTIFFHRDPDVARARLSAFASAMAEARVPRAVEKDINLATRLTGLGCELSSAPPCAAPDRDKLESVLLATLGIEGSKFASPKAIHSLLGIDQWFCLLSRAHFSCFRDAYSFVTKGPGDVPVQVPQGVLDELMLFCALAPLLTADLSRDWLPLVTATDAAPEFGVRNLSLRHARGAGRCHRSEGGTARRLRSVGAIWRF
jgi:hypothetical protein